MSLQPAIVIVAYWTGVKGVVAEHVTLPHRSAGDGAEGEVLKLSYRLGARGLSYGNKR